MTPTVRILRRLPGYVPPPPESPPCSHLGDQLTGREREALGLPHERDWRRCQHPAQPLGEAVCRCQGCGPGCAGYDHSPA